MRYLFILILLCLTSCINKEELIMQQGEAEITFTYTVPEELLKYTEITVCYNNNEGTDARWESMLENSFTVTYNINRFPMTAPVVMVYDTTNRPAGGVKVNWELIMDIEATINGETYVRRNIYPIRGDLGAEINKLIHNVTDRTYVVRISKDGKVTF